MFMTSEALAAAVRNEQKDSKFWSNPRRVSKHLQEQKDYEEFCKKFGYPE